MISKISADAGLMGNDYILSLRTEDGLVQRRAVGFQIWKASIFG